MLFEYYKGYEIDGSDTAYNVITPEIEKIKEIVKFYLSLKVINKSIPIKIYSVNFNRKHELVGREYGLYDLDKLWNDTAGFNAFELNYYYISPNYLYPEIKRELIDLIIKNSNVKESDLVNPVFSGNAINCGYMQAILNNPKSKSDYLDYENIQSEEYYENAKNNNPHHISIDWILGASSALKYYAMKKLSMAFPEYGINAELSLYDIYWYDIDLNTFIYEEIIIDSFDFEFSLNRVLENKNIAFVSKENNLKLRNSGYLYKMDKKLKFEYINITGKRDSYKNYDDNKLRESVAGVYEKYFDNTVKGYIEYVKKISKISFIRHEEFENYNLVPLRLKVSKGCTEYLSLSFKKEKKNLKMILVVPYKIRDYTEKILGLK